MRQKGLAPVIIIIIVALVAGLGYWGYKSGTIKINLPQDVTPTTSPTPTADPTANRKTYTDPLGNFSFKYPGNLTSKDLGNTVISFSDGQRVIFNFSGFKVLSSSQYRDFIQERKVNENLYEKKTLVDSQNRTWQTDMILGQVYNFTGIFNQQDKYYVVSLQSGSEDFKDNGITFRNLAEQILSTFKFTQ